jgi:hypothetical protein
MTVRLSAAQRRALELLARAPHGVESIDERRQRRSYFLDLKGYSARGPRGGPNEVLSAGAVEARIQAK